MTPAIRQAIALCLEKEPQKRLADIRDVRLALKGRFESALQSGATPAIAQPRWRRVLAHPASVLMGAVLLVVGAWHLKPEPVSAPQPVTRFAYALPQGFFNGGRNVMAFSADGRQLAINTEQGLVVRDMGELEAHLIPGSDVNVTNPFFAPDGQALAFWSATERKLKRIATAGGTPVIITDAPFNLNGASWSRDNTIFFGQADGIYRVAANGGTATLVIEAQAGEQLASPELLPDGDSVLFSATSGSWDEARILVQSLSSGLRTVLVERGRDAHYLATGHLIYAIADDLLAVAFDAATLTVSGSAVPIAQDVSRATISASLNYGVSANGTLVYLTDTTGSPPQNLVWAGRDGSETAIPIEPGSYTFPRISPNGTRVALNDRNQDFNIWIWDFASMTRTRLGLSAAGGDFPVWSVDGTRLAYNTPGAYSIAWKAANNTGLAENIATSTTITGQGEASIIPYPYFFSASGQELVFRSRSGSDDIGMLSMDGTQPTVWLLREAYGERNAVLSPDGRWMAYQSLETGRYEIYVRPFPNVNDDLVQVSNAGGVMPLWSRDGSELFYLQTDTAGKAHMMAAAVATTGATFTFGARTALLDWPYLFSADGRTYDVALDGQQFLALKEVINPGSNSARPQFVISLNWLKELERLVPSE